MQETAPSERVRREPATRTRRTRSGRRRSLAPLLWVGPAAVLIIVVVIWPVITMVETSFQKISPDGFVLGWAGFGNFTDLFAEGDIVAIVIRTIVWTVAVVAVTMLLAMGLAELFNQRFPGRRVARWALIAPWAASVMMTAIVFRWMLDPNTGVINLFLHDIGVLDLNTNSADWLGRPTAAFVWMMVVAVFVSLPFATYALLAGLQTIPAGLYEAAKVDGASRMRTYVSITLPLLRPAFTVALLINVMNVFNSFPIIWEMTRGGPGYQTSTTTTFMYILKQSYIGESGAMSVINFLLVIIIVFAFLKATRWKAQVSS